MVARHSLNANWPAIVSIAVLLGSWGLFLSGATDVPGWEGFGKGLAIGSLTCIAPIAGLLMRRATPAA